MIRILLIISFIVLNLSNAFSQCGKYVTTHYDKFNKTTRYNVNYNVDKSSEVFNNYYGTRLIMEITGVSWINEASNYHTLYFTIKEKMDRNKDWEEIEITDYKSNLNSYIQFLFVDGNSYRLRNGETFRFSFEGTLWLKGSAKESDYQNEFLNKLKTIKIEAIRLSVGRNYDFDLTSQQQQNFMEIFNCLP